MTPEELTCFLNDQIPLTKSLGVKVIHAHASGAQILAPLAPNRNHLGTAFGGSLSTTLILSGYVWLYHFLHEKEEVAHVILKSSENAYLLPVLSDFMATAIAPDPRELDNFLLTFQKKGIGRIFLSCEICIPEGKAATFRGEFVARKAETGQLG